jgi:hypothetical protein
MSGQKKKPRPSLKGITTAAILADCSQTPRKCNPTQPRNYHGLIFGRDDTVPRHRGALLERRASKTPIQRRLDVSYNLGSLLRLQRLPLAPPLSSLRPALSIESPIPPSERARVVANELLMVYIMVVRASPDRQEMVQRPGELISRMRINGLENAQRDPHVHGQDVQVLGDGAPQDGRADGAEAEDHDFDWGGVFGCEPEGRGVLVVDFVDVFVQGPPVHGAVDPVVPGVFEDEEDCDLVGHCEEGGEGDAGFEAAVLRHRVEEPNLREFDGEVGDEDELGAFPLFSCGGHFLLLGEVVLVLCSSSLRFSGCVTYFLNLVFLEVGNLVDDDPWQAAAEVDDLVHDEAHDAGGEHIIADVCVPRGPHALEVVEVDIVL